MLDLNWFSRSSGQQNAGASATRWNRTASPLLTLRYTPRGHPGHQRAAVVRPGYPYHGVGMHVTRHAMGSARTEVIARRWPTKAGLYSSTTPGSPGNDRHRTLFYGKEPAGKRAVDASVPLI